MVKISAALPTHMKAVVLRDYDGTPQSVAAADFSVPRLRSGQVLIRMAASPSWLGLYLFACDLETISLPVPHLCTCWRRSRWCGRKDICPNNIRQSRNCRDDTGGD